MIQPAKKTGRLFRLAHILWAVLAVSFCLLLVLAGGSGHPPAIILLPFVVVIWCAGHVIAWGVGRLEAMGREAARAANGEPGVWPPELIVALIATGILACAGLFQLAGTLLFTGWYPFQGVLWAVAMATSLAHAVCFVALLLRRSWSRPASALLCLGWALLVVWQLSQQLVHGHQVDIADYVIFLAIVSALLGLGYRVMTSRRIGIFLGL